MDGEKLVPYEDQPKAVEDLIGEIFGEDEPVWLVANGMSREDAAACFKKAGYEVDSDSELEIVRGVLGVYGPEEPYFQKAADGPVEMWELG